ncbi:MAG: hypothetical protein OXG37_09845 [Actinomycetia bacterium]|nr:hypothetical protein [Actinomycetes bacterium]
MAPQRQAAAAGAPLKDVQSIAPEGDRVGPAIEGLIVHELRTNPGERGEVCELYRSAWGLHNAPVEPYTSPR